MYNYRDRITVNAIQQGNRALIYPYVSGTYAEARRFASELGLRLASNKFVDQCLFENRAKNTLHNPLPGGFPALVEEIYAYPEANGIIRLGYDLVDSVTGDKIPACCIPDEAFGEQGVSLFINPAQIGKLSGGKFVYLANPKSAIVIRNSLQESGSGEVDELTRMPVATTKEKLRSLAYSQKRSLYRITGAAIRPLVRGFGAYCLDVRDYEGNISANLSLVNYQILLVAKIKTNIESTKALVCRRMEIRAQLQQGAQKTQIA